jgi:hypothetical protein
VKYCPQCGTANPDASNFCGSCGAAQPQSPIGQSGTGSSPSTSNPFQGKSPWERALSLLGSNLGLVLPLVVLFFIELVIFGIEIAALSGMGRLSLLGLFAGSASFLNAIYAIIGWTLTGIFLSITIFEVSSAVQGGRYSLSSAWHEVSSRIGDVVIVSLVMGILDLAWSFVPLISWLLTALTLLYFIGVFEIMLVGVMPLERSFGRGIDFLKDMADNDATTLLVLIVAAILSVVPVLQIFSLTFAAILSLLYFGERFRSRLTGSGTAGSSGAIT